MSIEDDPLAPSFRDQLVAIGKGISSLVPVVGGVLGELLGHVIPQQRADRIAAYLTAVEKRVGEMELSFSEIFGDADRVDLIEEGAFQAARATTDGRIETIARLVAHGLQPDDANVVRRNRLAKLLGQLDDDELLVLNAYGQSYAIGSGGEAWEAVNRPGIVHLQSSVEEVDASTLFEAGERQLQRLGLLEKRYRTFRRGEQPVFDPRKGDFEHTVQVSYLGRMLLRAIDQPSAYDAT